MKDGTLKLTMPTDREIVMTRVFDAPRALVFKAMSEPALVKRWLLGPPGWAMVVCEIDHRVGGSFRFEWKHESGSAMGVRGVYREIVPPVKSVHVESMDGYPGESLETVTLDEEGGRTTLTTRLLYPSKEVRDAVAKSGMEQGVTASYDRMAEVLKSMG